MRTISGPCLLGLFCLTFGISRTSAAPLTWDTNKDGSGTAGSGNWDTTAGNNVWYNGASDVLWSQGGTTTPTQGATFNGPDAAPGTYIVSVDAGQVAVTNLNINNSGYTFSGPSGIYLGANDFLNVAAGKTVTFNCNMLGSGTSPCWVLGSGATMNVGGNLGSGQQVKLAGPADCVFNLTGVNNPANLWVLAPVNLSGGSLIPVTSFYIGYTQTLPAPNSTAYTTGLLTVSGSSTVLTVNGNILIIGRSSGHGTLVLNDGTATIGNLTANRNLAICYDGSAGASAIVNINGGTLNVGSPSMLNNQIDFYQTAATPTTTATLNQTAGTINAWGGIIFGAASGSFSGGGATLTQSGGTLYVGQNGITRGANYTAVNNNTINITLSGGTVGTLANWASSVPMTLGAGSTTFQCANASSTPFNISLSGPLTGAGGLNVTGSGTLTLSGANNYAGTTVVSNGTLAIVTSSTPIANGPVTLDGAAGSPNVAITVSNPGQYWTNNGAFTFQNGSPTLTFQFGALSPSASVAPIQVTGNIAFTTTPNVNIGGAAIAIGTYPLVKYTGTTSGTTPSSVTLPGYASGYVTNMVASKTIAFVVTSSTYNPALYWRVGNGIWDINTTANWTQFGSPAKYADGNAVIFDDTASGPSPITVTLNTTVNPLSVTANATTNNYIITGTGSIAGSASLQLLGAGTVTLQGTNTYTGGTVINAGQLNINNGGSASATAIGTGPLTINSGASIDNTSGSNVTLQTAISQSWNGNFTYVGSANDLNTGAGQVTMNGSTTIAVSSNNFTVGSTISDNGLNFQLSKTGSGALTLPVANSFGGGLALYSGLLNLKDPYSAGYGVLTIYGGAIDNLSGADMTLSPASYVWSGNFSFLGSSNLDLDFHTVIIPNGLVNISLNVVSNTLTTRGDIVNNNTRVIKTGNGLWRIAGSSGGLQSLGLLVSAGQVSLAKTSGQAIQGGNNVGMTVQTNALVLDENAYQIHSHTAIPIPVVLAGGVWDLNGWNENVDQLSLSGGGTLRNSANAGLSTLTLISGYPATLTGANCQFDVQATNGILNINGVVAGSGSLVKTGLGVLNLVSNNTYTGSTAINNGTLALPGVGSLSNSAGIYLADPNSALDLSAHTDLSANPTPVLTLLAGQTLSGFGTVTGLVQSASGAIVAPGSPTAVGALGITGVAGANTLNGITMMKLDKGGQTNDQLSVSGSLVYGGTLAVANLSGSLAPGDSFTLFNAAGGYSGTFASINPSRPGYPGFGLAWNTNNLAVNGSLSVVATPVPASPRITTINLSGTTLAIQGTNGVANESFVLLESTNVIAPLSNWVPVSTNAFDGSGNFNLSITVTPSTPNQFFRVWMQ